MFAVWGHEHNNIAASDKPDGIPDLAAALMEGNDIPFSMHRTVCANDDEDPRLMDALHECILAVHSKTRPKSDSVLTPATVKLEDSFERTTDSLDSAHKILAGELERQSTKHAKKKKCCS